VLDGVTAVVESADKTRTRWFKDMTVKAQGSARSALRQAGIMDGGAAGMGGIQIDKSTKTNFHEWRQRIKMVLALRDLDDMLDEDGKPTDADDRKLSLWKRRDTKASAIIGLTIGTEQLEHVSGCKTTVEMWSTLHGVFQRKSLMNKMTARREFYTVAMNVGEGMLGYINRVRNLRENLKAMGGEVTEMDVAMSVLNGLTSKYENILVALDAKGEDELSLDSVKSLLLQEERRQADKSLSIKRIADMALTGANYRVQGRRGDSPRMSGCYCHNLGKSCTIAPCVRPGTRPRRGWRRLRLKTVAKETTPSVLLATRLTTMKFTSRGSLTLRRQHTCAGCARASTNTRRPRDGASEWVTKAAWPLQASEPSSSTSSFRAIRARSRWRRCSMFLLLASTSCRYDEGARCRTVF